MKAIITVIGRDRGGIIASVSTRLYQHGVNILDINQTIMGGYFTMVMLVDLGGMTCSFAEMTEALDLEGTHLGVKIRMQRSEIFDAMHRV